MTDELLKQITPVIKSKPRVRFKDEKTGEIKTGILKSNDGRCVVVVYNNKHVTMGRKEITFIK